MNDRRENDEHYHQQIQDTEDETNSYSSESKIYLSRRTQTGNMMHELLEILISKRFAPESPRNGWNSLVFGQIEQSGSVIKVLKKQFRS
ncbi:MAG: hypothetical protein CM1200mP28_15960 [Deltaproteobacteria bacterium]|nr:MAG: hypothetical protein CM1200mP28_15960 [Deltaproteobacteria bacterium]